MLSGRRRGAENRIRTRRGVWFSVRETIALLRNRFPLILPPALSQQADREYIDDLCQPEPWRMRTLSFLYLYPPRLPNVVSVSSFKDWITFCNFSFFS